MCTLVAAVKHFPGLPLVIAANRDEVLSRPATPPRLWPGTIPFVAPRDEQAGGTWLGLNANGLFVGVTNRFGATKDDKRDSRGKLVAESLQQSSAEALHADLSKLPADVFNAFHLLYADRDRAFVTWNDGVAMHQQELPPGVHIVTERSLGGDDKARTELIRQHWELMGDLPLPRVDKLMDLMRLHGANDPAGGTCVHVPAFNYGTRSSCVLLLGSGWPSTRLLWAEGSPHAEQYSERPDLIRLLTGNFTV
jgi:uncharacterized protein with NRDE domain